MKPPIKIFCFRTFIGAKINFDPMGIQIGVILAYKKMYKQTDIFVFI